MKIPIREKNNYFAGSRFVTELTPSDFDSIATWKLKDKHACSIVLFYAPWCYYCKKMKGMWEDLGEEAAFLNVYAMNCEMNSLHCNKIREDNPELIKSFPTMIIYTNGNPTEKVGTNENNRTVGKLMKDCMRVCSNQTNPPVKQENSI